MTQLTEPRRPCSRHLTGRSRGQINSVQYVLDISRAEIDHNYCGPEMSASESSAVGPIILVGGMPEAYSSLIRRNITLDVQNGTGVGLGIAMNK
jgi:hypothetical protein